MKKSLYTFSKNEKSASKKTNKKYCNGNKLRNFIIPISGQVLTELISYQIKLPLKLKDKDFNKNLRLGISRLIRCIVNAYTLPYISGIKVVCSGRWQKTRSSRKQRMTYLFGKLERQTFSKFIDYGFSYINTKYGVCSVKV
jgi:hypothetical protein